MFLSLYRSEKNEFRMTFPGILTTVKKGEKKEQRELRRKITEKRKNRSNHRTIIIYQILQHYTVNKPVTYSITGNVNSEN
ncbi:hypothetical protein EO95_04010 [Methanosarcina sp. 1.H.T.1A.1]|nr:hypothetical protein EO95_04010 [Methanosarcina sp. 1.H.T.1A.1]